MSGPAKRDRPPEGRHEQEIAETQSPLCEPHVIDPVFADGIEVETSDERVIRLMAWVAVPGERRVVARLVITNWKARMLAARLQGTFAPQH